jgi:hypothetical protein
MVHWGIYEIGGIFLAIVAIAMLTMAAMKQKDRK